MKQRVVRQTGPGLHGQKEKWFGQKDRSIRQAERKETMPLEVAAGVLNQRPGAGNHPTLTLRMGKTMHLGKVRKEVPMRSIMYAYIDSVRRDVTEFVNAFVILYRAEVI